MAKNKLRRFSELSNFSNVFQPGKKDYESGFYLKGKWKNEYFGNNKPITLELGCGKGEYTTRLAEKYPEKNFIGIDIKGARIWVGCRYAIEKKLKNVVFIRTQIENLESFFEKNEINEIWLTFPDPQLASGKAKKRLTSPRFLNIYKNIISGNCIINLKTDNFVLYNYTLEIINNEKHKLLFATADLYGSDNESQAKSIQTYYEKIHLKNNLKICYIRFSLR
ncbi:MAG: tRNA (guanosine(46)-N7)-methyltransferase TrmB [Bacteroidales bacterium]|nr:tRNA (guanosine(46)-N7)-methyltransferase TrmB [Bacteroidales bacterium]